MVVSTPRASCGADILVDLDPIVLDPSEHTRPIITTCGRDMFTEMLQRQFSLCML